MIDRFRRKLHILLLLVNFLRQCSYYISCAEICALLSSIHWYTIIHFHFIWTYIIANLRACNLDRNRRFNILQHFILHWLESVWHWLADYVIRFICSKNKLWSANNNKWAIIAYHCLKVWEIRFCDFDMSIIFCYTIAYVAHGVAHGVTRCQNCGTVQCI
jgi:hypothetical protein